MKIGSLLTPSKTMLLTLPLIIKRPGIVFKPAIPQKDDIFVCTNIYKNKSGRTCVEVDNLKLYLYHHLVHLNSYLFVEIQPPVEVKVEELISESVEA